MYRIRLVTILLAIFTIIGCGGGGGGGDDPISKIKIIPSNHDFGIVTTNNMPAPLEVKIQNNGSATLKVSDITLADKINFILDLAGGENPCNTASPSIRAGSVCTVEVDFQPDSEDIFSTILSIRSDDPNTPLVNVSLNGISEQITALNVKINQVASTDSCPDPSDVTAYVSVTDQGGYPVTGLLKANFSVVEDLLPIDPIDVSLRTVSQAPLSTLSVAVAMDYSGSITVLPDVVDDMEENISEFINQLRAIDEAEILKFDATVTEVIQGFTSDIALLTSAIFARFDNKGNGTPIYDAVIKAVDDVALRSGDRKVVVVITDGGDTTSSAILSDVISNADTKGISVFVVGIGNLNLEPLQQIADETGGLFYEADNSDNTKTVLQQLADLFYTDQYVLTYETAVVIDAQTADLEIAATKIAITGDDDTRAITPCP